MPKVVSGYKEAARSRIVEAALKVFSEKGYDESTMDDVAEQLGVTKGALYPYFKGKNDLLEAVYSLTRSIFREALERSFEGRDFVGGMKVLLDWLNNQYAKSYGLFFEWFAEVYHDEEVKRYMKADGERDLETWRAFIDKGKRQGILETKMDSRVLAQILETLFIGAWMRTALGHEKSEVMRSLHDMFRLVESKR